MAEEEGNTFQDLVYQELEKAFGTQFSLLGKSEMEKLNAALSIYDQWNELSRKHDYSYEDDQTIAERIAHYLAARYRNQLSPLELQKLDITNFYPSVVINSILVLDALNYDHDNEFDPEKEIMKFPGVENQKKFLFYTFIPYFNSGYYDQTITEVTWALADPSNPRYNSAINRYLREKFGNAYFLRWRELFNFTLFTSSGLNNEKETVDTILEKISFFISQDEEAKYTPGTRAYNKMVDEYARKTGKLDPQCQLDDVELEVLLRMYLKDATMTQMCQITAQFSDRFELDGPCEDYNLEELIEPVSKLVLELPKYQICEILKLLGKTLTIPLLLATVEGVKIYPQVVTASVLALELPSPYYDYEEQIEDYARISALKNVIEKYTGYQISDTNVIPKKYSIRPGLEEPIYTDDGYGETDWWFFQNNEHRSVVILKGMVRFRIIDADRPIIGDIILQAGDILEVDGFNKISKVIVESSEFLAFHTKLLREVLPSRSPSPRE